MKKKFLTFLFAICLIIPCAFMLSACGKEPDKEPVSVTVEFTMSTVNGLSPEVWDIDESTHTYKTTHMNAFVWHKYMFEVTATTATGDSTQLQEVTENNPMGYKIDTNMPETDGLLPVGTYTYRLYCEEFDNGEYKAEACESETYTIIVEKEPIELKGYEWEYDTSDNTYIGDSISVRLNLQTYWQDSYIDMESAGITNFRYIEEEPYTLSATDVGKYTAKIEYDADTANFDYGDKLPEKTFEWEIKKADPKDWIGGNLFGYSEPVQLDYIGQEFEMYVATNELDFNPAGITITGFEGDYKVSKPGKYTCKPIFSQTDTKNFEILNADDFVIEWEVLPIVINPENLLWNYNEYTDFTYDPNQVEPYNVALDGSAYEGCYFDYEIDLSNNITNSAKDAGIYTAKAILKFEEGYEDYYVLEEELQPCVWEIKKQTLYLDSIQWWITQDGIALNEVNNYIIYNGNVTEAILPTEMSYPFEIVRYETYDKNQQLITKDIVEPGTYTTKVIITYDENNYVINDETPLTYEWEIKKDEYGECLFWYYVQMDSSNNTLTTTRFETPETLVLSEAGNYFLIGFTTHSGEPYEELNIQLSIDDGNTYVDELTITETGTYTIKIKITGQD
ncbi:MAG: hypothetical protein IJZ26_02445, partial [Clostridia bacterium]|nr:hypothetical protein [Clostridia bacterium]